MRYNDLGERCDTYTYERFYNYYAPYIIVMLTRIPAKMNVLCALQYDVSLLVVA